MAFKQDLSCFSFTCSAQSEELTSRLKHSNKILLPPSILYALNEQKQLENADIMFFKVTNKELNFGQVCGVHEFSAPPAICHVPYHVMDNLAITEGSIVRAIRQPYFGMVGKVIDLPSELTALESGTFARVAKVEFDDKKYKIIPRTNLELIIG